MKRLFLLIFFLASGCYHNTDIPSDTLVIGVESFPQTLDPRFTSDALSSKICRLIYSGLFKLNDKLELVPDLASEYRFVSPTVLEITLRPHVSFHNGKQLTPEDVIATLTSLKNSASPFKTNFDKMESIKQTGPQTLSITLTQPYTPFLSSLTMGILPKEMSTEQFKPIGTGPYQLGQVTENRQVELLRFDSYYEGMAKNHKLIFKTILDDTLRTLELLKGRLDLVQNAIPLVLLPAVAKEKKLDIKTDEGINFNYMGFNLKDPVLQNKKVREAIALGLNRNELIQYKLKNMATPATSLLFPHHWAFNQNMTAFSYNPEKAKHLLDEAGLTDPDGEGSLPRLHLTYKTSTKKDRVELALLMAEQLRKIGIEVEVKPYEWGTFFNDIRQGNFQIYSLTWVGLTDPDIYYWAFHSSQTPPTGANRGFYINPQLDALLVEAQKTADRGEQKKILDEIQQRVYDDFVYVPLWYENNWVVISKKIKNYTLRADAGFQNLFQAYKTDTAE